MRIPRPVQANVMTDGSIGTARPTLRPWRPLVVAIFAGGSLACSSQDAAVTPAVPPPPSPVTIAPTPAPFVVAPAASAEGSVRLVYFSLPPGSLPSGTGATIVVRGTKSSATTPLVNGGFDPIVLAASTGDTVSVTVQLAGSTQPGSYLFAVPRPGPPVVVRSDPPPHKRDVALNASLRVVFSQPIDPATVTGSAMELRSGDVTIAGQVAFAIGSPNVIEFTPATPLRDAGDFVLVVKPVLRDVLGNALSAPDSIPFSTAAIVMPVANMIAFTDSTPGLGRLIYVMSPDGSGRRVVTSVPTGTDTWPASTGWGRLVWSPDGKRLGYESGGAVFTINADGSNGGMLGQPGSTDTQSGAQAWSPDGTLVAFGSFTWYWANRATGIYVSNPYSVVSPGGRLGTAVRLTTDNDWWPSWSPDGARIAFVRYTGDYFLNPGLTGNSEIWLMNSDGSNPRALTQLGGGIFGLSWSPDGMRLAFNGTVAGCSAIYLVNPDGSGMVRLTQCGAGDRDPSWSPDSRRLVFERNRDIYVMNADGTGVTRLTFSGSAIDPAWAR